jgi:Na+-transporting NADH:ubiquinone oxidoreductase subunit C
MKSGYVYTIIFMLIVSAVFTLVLAGANELFLPKIEQNELLDERLAILYVFDIDQSGSADEVLDRFDKYVAEKEMADIKLYEYKSESGSTEAYAVPFSGAGLWGIINGYMAVSPDLTKITGVVFTEHSETPGLGGRIDELAYREQFRGISINAETKLAYGEDGGGRIDAITGATQTSNAVMKILNNLLDSTIYKLEVTAQ